MVKATVTFLKDAGEPISLIDHVIVTIDDIAVGPFQISRCEKDLARRAKVLFRLDDPDVLWDLRKAAIIIRETSEFLRDVEPDFVDLR